LNSQSHAQAVANMAARFPEFNIVEKASVSAETAAVTN
jgi:hypothetical protein